MLVVSEEVPAGEPASPAAVWRRVGWRLLPPLFMTSFLCQLDRSNLSFAALTMDAELGFSRTIHGLGSGLFVVGYLAQVPANMACLALGPRRWLPILLACWGAVAMCFAAVRGQASFLALRLLLGVAEAGAYPAIMVQLSLFYPSRALGVAYTWVATATAAAGLLGAPLAAALLSLDGVAGLRGWQWLFLVEGALPLLLAAVLPFFLLAGPLSAGFLTPAQQQWLWCEVHGGSAGIELVEAAVPAVPKAAAQRDARGSADTAAEAGEWGHEEAALLQPGQPHSPSAAKQPAQQGSRSIYGSTPGSGSCDGGLSREAVRAGLGDRRVWHLAAVMLLIDVCMNAANFWLPTLVKAALQGQLRSDNGSSSGATESSNRSTSVGVPPALPAAPPPPHHMGIVIKSSLLSALPFCAAAICMVANARHAKRHNERRLHTALPMLATALALAVLPAASAVGPAAALAALTLAAAGIWSTHGPFFSWPAAFLDPRAAALGFALMKTGGAIGGFIGPFVVGAMADALHGYTGAMLLLAGVAAAAAALVLVFDDRRK